MQGVCVGGGGSTQHQMGDQIVLSTSLKCSLTVHNEPSKEALQLVSSVIISYRGALIDNYYC